jgi:hypothetical protein
MARSKHGSWKQEQEEAAKTANPETAQENMLADIGECLLALKNARSLGDPQNQEKLQQWLLTQPQLRNARPVSLLVASRQITAA